MLFFVKSYAILNTKFFELSLC